MRNILCLTLLSFLLVSCSNSNDPSNEIPTELRVGVLIPLNSSETIDGISMHEAIKLAREDYIANSGRQLELVFKDSEMHYSIMANALQEFKNEGISIVVSASTSFNLYLVEELIAELDIVVIDVTSTSTKLSKEDNIFRLVPDDSNTANIMSKALASRNVNNAGIIYRGDIWGSNLGEGLGKELNSLGKNVFTDLPYNPRFPELSIPTDVKELNTSVSTTLNNSSAEETAVILYSFEEGNEILKEASKYESLSKITWYGSDGIVNSQRILSNDTAFSFASKTGLFCPVIGEGSSSNYQSLKNQIASEIGYEPHVYSLVAYDATQIAALALEAAGDDFTTEELINLVNKTATETYDGVTNAIDLNENFDRINCSYDFWGVRQNGQTKEWYKAFSIN